MEPSGRNWSQPWQMVRRRNGADRLKTGALRCDQLSESFHGKEGVDGSSPSEGFRKASKGLHLGPPLELGSSTTTSLQRGPDEQLPRNYRVEGRQRLFETSLASESDSQAFVVANCGAEDVRITGRIAGLTVVEVRAEEVHLA